MQLDEATDPFSSLFTVLLAHGLNDNAAGTVEEFAVPGQGFDLCRREILVPVRSWPPKRAQQAMADKDTDFLVAETQQKACCAAVSRPGSRRTMKSSGSLILCF